MTLRRAAAVLAIAVLVFLPPVIAFVGLSAYGASLINFSTALLVVPGRRLDRAAVPLRPVTRPPRTGRSPPAPRSQPLLWLIASGLSFYVSHIARFGATYGPLGAVVASCCGSTFPPTRCCSAPN